MTDNDIEQFTSAMVLMFKNFKRPVENEIIRLNFLSLKHLSLADAQTVISEAILSEDSFPTLHRLRGYQSKIPLKPQPRVEYKTGNSPKLAEQSMKLINALMDGKLSNEQYVEGMMAMDAQYPGTGWKEAAASLTQTLRNL